MFDGKSLFLSRFFLPFTFSSPTFFISQRSSFSPFLISLTLLDLRRIFLDVCRSLLSGLRRSRPSSCDRSLLSNFRRSRFSTSANIRHSVHNSRNDYPFRRTDTLIEASQGHTVNGGNSEGSASLSSRILPTGDMIVPLVSGMEHLDKFLSFLYARWFAAMHQNVDKLHVIDAAHGGKQDTFFGARKKNWLVFVFSRTSFLGFGQLQLDTPCALFHEELECVAYLSSLVVVMEVLATYQIGFTLTQSQTASMMFRLSSRTWVAGKPFRLWMSNANSASSHVCGLE